jgi:hypothetical protein
MSTELPGPAASQPEAASSTSRGSLPLAALGLLLLVLLIATNMNC